MRMESICNLIHLDNINSSSFQFCRCNTVLKNKLETR